MFKPGTYEYGLKTGDLSEQEIIKIFKKVSNLFLELYPNREKNGRLKFTDEGIIWNLYVDLLSNYPKKLSKDDPIQEFGSRVMQELFQTLPCEKVFIKKYALGENRL